MERVPQSRVANSSGSENGFGSGRNFKKSGIFDGSRVVKKISIFPNSGTIYRPEAKFFREIELFLYSRIFFS